MITHRRSVACLLILLSAQFTCAQPLVLADSLIQMWRWESDDGYSTIDVCSSHLLLFEGNPYEFRLSNGAFYFIGGRASIPFRYDAEDARLTLFFPEGGPLEYHRAIGSVYLRRLTSQRVYNGRALYGRFCTAAGTNGERRAIAFWSNGEFDFSPGTMYASIGTDESAALGTAVLRDNVVIFSFYSGEAAEAQVGERNAFGEVTRIVFANEEYVASECGSIPPPPPPPMPPASPQELLLWTDPIPEPYEGLSIPEPPHTSESHGAIHGRASSDPSAGKERGHTSSVLSTGSSRGSTTSALRQQSADGERSSVRTTGNVRQSSSGTSTRSAAGTAAGATSGGRTEGRRR